MPQLAPISAITAQRSLGPQSPRVRPNRARLVRRARRPVRDDTPRRRNPPRTPCSGEPCGATVLAPKPPDASHGVSLRTSAPPRGPKTQNALASALQPKSRASIARPEAAPCGFEPRFRGPGFACHGTRSPDRFHYPPDPSGCQGRSVTARLRATSRRVSRAPPRDRQPTQPHTDRPGRLRADCPGGMRPQTVVARRVRQ